VRGIPLAGEVESALRHRTGHCSRVARLGSFGLPGYNRAMTKEQIKAALDRVLTWPAERQEEVAEMIVSIEERDSTSCRLTDEQVAEVRRRRAEAAPETMSFEEFTRRLRRFGVLKSSFGQESKTISTGSSLGS
jgi:hypothetical protein